MLRQSLALKQQAKLSPQQIKLMKLIQLPATALEQQIEEELVENPALEEGEDEPMDEENPEVLEDEKNEDDKIDDDEINLDEYFQDDEIPDYKTKANNTSPDEERKTFPIAVSVSFQDYLHNQIGLYDFDEKQEIIAEQIIGSIDDDGYLRRPLNQIVNDLAFSLNISCTEKEIEDVMLVIQSFDPPGICARDLRECLLLQAKRKDITEGKISLAIHILEKYFEEFSNKNFGKILKEMNMAEDTLKEVMNEIIKLNPKPGGSSSDSQKSNQVITPDFLIVNNEGKLELSLNAGNSPELRVSRQYREMLKQYQENKKKSKSDKEAVQFVKQKLDAAQWFIDAINERHRTLLKTMTAIMEYQYEYFLTGDETKLKPMVLKDIAAITDYDMSTISRVTNSKYVQTPNGTFLLKYFFSERVKTGTGEEASAREVKRIIMNMIESEDKHKPFTDEEISKTLKENNYTLARRTVAKYREMLNIPTARMRKEI